MELWKERLLIETQEEAIKLNKLNVFMASDIFPSLTRFEKDLLYKQNILMTELVQILGKRLENYKITFKHNK